MNWRWWLRPWWWWLSAWWLLFRCCAWALRLRLEDSIESIDGQILAIVLVRGDITWRLSVETDVPLPPPRAHVEPFRPRVH
jgi:hypothetical protein